MSEPEMKGWAKPKGAPAVAEEDLDGWAEEVADYVWRFSSIYWIKPAKGDPSVLFEPREAQWEILHLIYRDGNVRLGILKARQLGFSTLLALICLDFMLFRPGVRIGVVDQTAEDAEKKRLKIKFAWEHLPADVRQTFRIIHDSKGRFGLKMREQGDKERLLYAGKNVRGDTHDLLWISEWGPIQVEDSNRSDKIADGGLPSVEQGICVIETTWRGGKTGRLWTDVVKMALEINEEYRTKKDWMIKFYPWHLDDQLVWEGTTKQITKECLKYLKEIEPLAINEATKLGFKFNGFSTGQKLWYFKVVWPKPRRSRYEEYPTIMAEMFLSPEPGAIYAEEMATLRSQRRLTWTPVERGHKAIFSFDLGRDDAMPCCVIQWIGQEVRLVDYHTANREVVPYYADWVLSWLYENKISTAQVLLPHDSRAHKLEARLSVEEQFEELLQDVPGMNIEVMSVDVCASVWDGIDDVRSLFPYLHISTKCDEEVIRGEGQAFPGLVDCLDHYHSLEIRDGRNISRDVVHDKYCHGADSLRSFAEGKAKGMIHRAASSRKRIKVQIGHGDMAGGGKGKNIRLRIKGQMRKRNP